MRFVKLLEAPANQVSAAVSVGMLADDDKAYRFDIAAGCAPLLIAALAAEMGKLNTDDVDHQFILAKALATAVSDSGAPMLLLTLESGAVLPLVFESGDLNDLIGELQALKSTVAPGHAH